MIPRPKQKHRPLHPPQLLPIPPPLKPPLRPIAINIPSEGGFVALDDDGTAADDRAAGDEAVADRGAGGGDDAFEVEAEGGLHAEGFLDAGVEVGERAGGGVGDWGGF